LQKNEVIVVLSFKSDYSSKSFYTFTVLFLFVLLFSFYKFITLGGPQKLIIIISKAKQLYIIPLFQTPIMTIGIFNLMA